MARRSESNLPCTILKRGGTKLHVNRRAVLLFPPSFLTVSKNQRRVSRHLIGLPLTMTTVRVNCSSLSEPLTRARYTTERIHTALMVSCTRDGGETVCQTVSFWSSCDCKHVLLRVDILEP